MKKVRANEHFRLPVDKTIGRPREDGEEFIVSDERANQLYNAGLVEIIEDMDKIAEVAEIIENKPKKRK